MRKKEFLGTVAVAVGLVVGALVPAANAKAPAVAPIADPEIRGQIDAYQKDYPGLSAAQAARATAGQKQRVDFLGKLSAERPDGFGGSWFDPRTNTQHVNTVDTTTAARAKNLGRQYGLTVVTHRVRYSTGELEALAARSGQGKATADYQHNRVIANAADSARRVPEVCTDRFHCGTPLRSGIVLWAQTTSGRINECSLAFTAAATDGSKWAVTAGHCGAVTGDGGLWGHGEQPIGPIRYGRQDTKIDVAGIHVQGSYWKTGGWFFNGAAGQANTPLPVDGAVTSPAQIQVGDTACLSAWHSTYNHSCGTITWPGSATSMAKVTFDACPGDSGGGWYFKTSAGARVALGIHHGQPPDTTLTCHQHAQNDSIFSTLPNINYWWDQQTAARLRVETR